MENTYLRHASGMLHPYVPCHHSPEGTYNLHTCIHNKLEFGHGHGKQSTGMMQVGGWRVMYGLAVVPAAALAIGMVPPGTLYYATMTVCYVILMTLSVQSTFN